jgi:hypothetical protein
MSGKRADVTDSAPGDELGRALVGGRLLDDW